MYKLCSVAVHESEDDGRQGDGHPVVAGVEEVQQGAQHSASEHDFLGQWGKDADDQIAGRSRHDVGEEALHGLGHVEGQLLLQPFGGDEGAQGEEGYPYQHAPRACPQIGGR